MVKRACPATRAFMMTVDASAAQSLSGALPLFLLGYRLPAVHPPASSVPALPRSVEARPGSDGSKAEEEAGQPSEMSVPAALRRLVCTPAYVVHAVCCALLGGISFAITGLQEPILLYGLLFLLLFFITVF